MVEVDYLLSEAEVRQSNDLAEEENLSLPQLEEKASLNTSREEDVTDEGPVLDRNIFLFVLQFKRRSVGSFFT